MLLSCSSGQRAWEDKKWEHGVFFYHVLSGLRQGNTTAAKLQGYLEDSVARDVKDKLGALASEQDPYPLINGRRLDFGIKSVVAATKPDPKKAVEDPLLREMKFVQVPKGTFWMGWTSEKKESKQVTIANDFQIAAYTVTQGQWEAVMGTNPSYYSRQGDGKDRVKDISDADLKRFPVETVSWNDVHDFLKKLNERERGKGWTYRLPTEAEWEYACRGAATSKEECSYDFYLQKPSNDLSSTQANFDGDNPGGNAAKGPYLGRPTPVGSYAPNKLGLYDMHGNVWQWCQDLYDPGASARVLRGGGWGSDGGSCRAGFRNGIGPDVRSSVFGFRLAAVPVGAE